MSRTAHSHLLALLLAPLWLLIGQHESAAQRAPSPRHSDASSSLWRELERGAHRVGYRGSLIGALPLHVWYPTQSDGARTSYATYLGAGADAFAKQLAGAGIPAASLDSILRLPTIAVEGATPLRGSYPVVVIAQGNGQDLADQAILAEYLASHGYVVVTTPSPMVARPMKGEEEITMFAELQAAQMDSAVRAAREMTGTASDAVVAIGHSFGARSALLYTMQHPEVRGLVSLDGGIGTATGLDYLRRSAMFDPARALPPILHEYELLDTFMQPDLTFLKGLRTSRLTLQQRESMHHIHFTTLGFIAAASPAFARVTRAGDGLAREVREVAASVRRFADEVARP